LLTLFHTKILCFVEEPIRK